MTLSELWRRVQNIVVTAEVVATKAQEGRMLVQVKYDEACTSDWLPVVSKNNTTLKVWTPMTVGEQVVVLRPFGSSDGGIAFPSIFSRGNKEPDGATENNVIVEFHDGARFEYDTSTKELKVKAENLNLVCKRFICTGEAFFKDSVDIDGGLSVSEDVSTEGSYHDAIGELSEFTTTNGGRRAS